MTYGSVSSDAAYRQDVFKMAAFLEAELKAVGVSVKSVPLGKQKLGEQELDLPPAILGEIGNDPNKKTILCYGHFDVQPVRRICCSLEISLTSKTFYLL